MHRCRKIQAVDSGNITANYRKRCDSTAWGGCRVAVDHGKHLLRVTEIIDPVFRELAAYVRVMNFAV